TNNSTSAGTLEVDFLDNSGTLSGHDGPVSVPVGATYMVLTNPVVGVIGDSVVSSTVFTRGSVRIFAKQLGCTAFVVDRTSNPPVSMMTLPVFKGVKQK